MTIIDVDKSIAELREDGNLPIAGMSDRDALEKFLRLGCEDNWDAASKRCSVAQSTWEAFLRECNADKVWAYER
jgi:hypothetical protein